MKSGQEYTDSVSHNATCLRENKKAVTPAVPDGAASQWNSVVAFNFTKRPATEAISDTGFCFYHPT